MDRAATESGTAVPPVPGATRWFGTSAIRSNQNRDSRVRSSPLPGIGGSSAKS